MAQHAPLEASRGIAELEGSLQGWINAITRGALHTLPKADRPPPVHAKEALSTRFGSWLAAWAAAVRPRHLVLLLDDLDCLADEPLTSVLVRDAPGRHAIELKRVRPPAARWRRCAARGYPSSAGCLDTLGLDGGWMPVFDQRPARAWDEKLWRE